MLNGCQLSPLYALVVALDRRACPFSLNPCFDTNYFLFPVSEGMDHVTGTKIVTLSQQKDD